MTTYIGAFPPRCPYCDEPEREAEELLPEDGAIVVRCGACKRLYDLVRTTTVEYMTQHKPERR